VKREVWKGEGKKGKEKEGRGREWRVKMCCPMSNKLSPPDTVPATHSIAFLCNSHALHVYLCFILVVFYIVFLYCVSL